MRIQAAKTWGRILNVWLKQRNGQTAYQFVFVRSGGFTYCASKSTNQNNKVTHKIAAGFPGYDADDPDAIFLSAQRG